MIFKENYWDNSQHKRSFIKFVTQTHNLDLTFLDTNGFWDENYRPFTFFEGAAVISNVCVYSMELLVRGVPKSVAQISAVGTAPQFRRRGLNRELTQRAMDWAAENHEFFFLFSDEGAALSFYAACGFRPVSEYKTQISVVGQKQKSNLLQLDVRNQEHLQRMYRFACERTPVSDVLGVFNAKLFMFWCLSHLKDCIYYCADLDVLVLFRRNGSALTLFDIVGRNMPEFSALYPYIAGPDDLSVEFLFMTDKLNLDEAKFVKTDGNRMHLYGEFPLEETEIIFPYTGHA